MKGKEGQEKGFKERGFFSSSFPAFPETEARRKKKKKKKKRGEKKS